MKIMNKRKMILLLTAVVLLLVAAVGGTVAYLSDRTGTVENVFEPASVVPAIAETFADGASVKENVYIWNNGTVDAYIRAKIVVTWQNAEGEVYGTVPVAGTDYTIEGLPGDGWTLSEGFYYYANKVKPSETAPAAVTADYTTSNLLTKCEVNSTANEPDGYTLHVEILAQAIQAEGMGANSAVEAFQKAAQ